MVHPIVSTESPYRLIINFESNELHTDSVSETIVNYLYVCLCVCVCMCCVTFILFWIYTDSFVWFVFFLLIKIMFIVDAEWWYLFYLNLWVDCVRVSFLLFFFSSSHKVNFVSMYFGGHYQNKILPTSTH